MTRWTALIFGLLLFALPAIAKQAPATVLDPPMTVTIVRSTMAGCEPDCPQWIAAEGRITAATPGVFRKVLKQAGKRALPVIVNSPGGDVNAAIAIGRMIRAKKLDVAVGWTYYAGCEPKKKDCKLPKHQKGVYRGLLLAGQSYCSSACSLIFAGGTRRILSPGAALGVHQISTRVTPERVTYREKYRVVNGKKRVLSRTVVGRKKLKGYTTTKLSEAFQKKLKTYLSDMGVSVALLDFYAKAPPEGLYWMTPADMAATKLGTDTFDAMSLGSAAICRGAAKAVNCVRVEPPTLN
jgi:hypothetical protein